MKMQKITAMLLAGVMCFTGIFANGNIANAANGTAEEDGSARVEEILSGMTTRQKITQMMMPDFRYWDEDLTDDVEQAGVTVMNGQIEQIVKDYDFGGVILFAQNVTGTTQTLNLTKQYQAAATADGGTPLLIGIDQEGGSVYRLGTGTALPGNMAVGAAGSVDYAKKNGEIIGRELSSLGINCNFAPVMDVNNNPNNPVIGLRSFSDDPQTVADMGVAMIEGMNEYNIAASAKHFLGHGDTGTDSHTGLPVVDKSREELEQMELVPFKAAMAADVDMFMTAHIVYPQIDDTKVVSQKTGEEVNLPATLSKKILTDLVRGDLGYDGVLITDAMNMAGVSGNFGQVEASIRAIQAGIDILLMPCVLYNLDDLKDLDAIIDGIEAAVADGTIPEERLNESCERILKLKEKRGILDYDADALTEENALEQVGSAENREIEREMSAAAVTVVKNENDTLPVKLTKDSKVLFLTPWDNEPALLAMGWNRAKEEGLVPAGAECKTICTTYQNNLTAEMQTALEWADVVIAVSEIGGNEYLYPSNWGHFHYSIPEQASAYCKEHGKKSIVMSVDKPYDIQFYENADAVLAVYGCMGSKADPTEILNGGITTTAEAFGPNMTAGVEVIFGVFGASGKLPVNINRLDMGTMAYTDEIVYERGTGITYPAVQSVQRRIKKMTTRQKITQMMMPDFRYWDEDLTDDVKQVGVTEMNSQIEQIVKDYDFGGVILFAQNVTETVQTLNLTKQYQAAATADGGTPLLIGIDQEGGSVYRLGTGTALPGNMAVGAAGSVDYAKKNGEIIGRELSSLGINCNFAPVMDVNNNPNNPVIGLRSFSDDPQTVADMGVAMIEGMNEYNIAASAKHFLGHGDTGTDSHTGLPVVDKSREELEKMELVPFKAAMAADVDMFMTAHIVYPQIDDTKVVSQKTGEEVNLPATLSKKILTDLVRGDLGYDGVLITDAMNMEGVAGNFGQVEAAIRAIQAGIDILLMPCVLYNLDDLKDLDAIIDGIEAAVADGSIPEERLNESCERILKLKEKRGILDYDADALTEENALEQVGSEENRTIEREMSAAAVTVVKNENNTLPVRLTEDSKVLFLTPWENEPALLAMGWNRVKEEGMVPAGAECKTIYFEYQRDITPQIQEALEWSDTVIVVSEIPGNYYLNPSHWGYFSYTLPEQVTTYCKENGKKSIVMSVDKPYDIQFCENADAMLAVYGCMGSSADPTEILNGGITTTAEAFGPNMTAGVEVIFGVFGASGKLPVNINRLDMGTMTYTDEIVYERGTGITYPALQTAQRKLSKMTTRQKITQMMMPDFRYWDEDLTDSVAQVGVTVMNSQIEQIVKDYDFGGVILFAQNVTGTTQTLNLTKQYQAAATADGGIPLLIGIDQEGGSVYRLGTGTALPGNMAVGATDSVDYAKKNGEIIGRELSSLGINCNFAPVMDVNNNPNNPVIGLRSFSDDPQTVADMGVAMIEGMNEYNIAASAKHFLGHGDTGTDSHTGLPVVDKSREELEKMELVPFKAAMAADVDMFMTAHIVYPQIDDTKVVSQKTGKEVNLPATLSKKILTDLVRKDLGYDGVLITDAMNMEGVAGNFGQVEAAIRAIQAGIDILLMPCVLYNLDDLKDLDAIIDGIEAAVADGTITEERLNESCERILKLKEKRGILDYDGSVLTEENAKAQVGSEENRAIEREMAAAAATVVKNENNVLPLKLDTKSKVLFLTPYKNELPCVLMGWTRAKQARILPEGAECKAVWFTSSSTLKTKEIKEALEWADTVIVNSEVSSATNMQAGRWVTKFPTDVSNYCKENGKKSVILSVDKPYDVQHYANADAVLAVYGCKGSSADPTEILNGGITATETASGPNITAGVEVALGVFGASGKLPVNIYRFDEATKSYTDEIVYERGYGLSYEAAEPYSAEKAEALILAVGEVSLTEECAEAIQAAKAYYQALNASEKARVSNYQELLAASAKYDGLKAEAAANGAEAAKEAAEAAKAEAGAAKAEAEAAQQAAETAKEAAETAKAEAETAKTGAKTAKADAEAARDAAETAKADAAAKAEAAEAAQAAAETAKAEAEAAQQRAEEAEDTTGMYAVAAEAAQAKAEAAQEAAEAAGAAAEAAQAKAEAAKEGADAAELKAEAAQAEAEAAQTKAEAAQTKAEAAAGTAETAQQYAEAAQTAAETAQMAAEAAAEAAGASAEDAAEAQSKAEAAKAAAEAAQAKAETAKTAAETAKVAAEAAQAAAEAAIDAAEAEADAAKEAKHAAELAQVKAEAAQAKAEATIEKAEAAQAKAEAAQIKAEAAQALAEAAAERAKDEAERAKDEAEKAKAEAEKAKAEVEKAKAEAEKAKAEAEKAKAEAEKAKAEIENVKAEVEKARAEAEKAAAAAAAAQKTLLEIKNTQTQAPAPVKITVNKKKFTLKRGKKARIKAKASDGSRLTFKSSNKKVVKVTAKGVIKAVKKGKAVITIKAGTVTKKVKVTVKSK